MLPLDECFLDSNSNFSFALRYKRICDAKSSTKCRVRKGIHSTFRKLKNKMTVQTNRKFLSLNYLELRRYSLGNYLVPSFAKVL